ncbi:Lrp/AsnC ligand binding domain-containing protein [Streptomyces iranensis]|uniref:Transcription regulator AsnC/Lrp ligand binding domain-containing protein n=1 Tax=Streptomyces iranensis TaxID=576784 RepID=A0A061AE92_9ACTN|nr:Lrp/AsnC ligand binding domain-containing protein [Streptomyces iranensis]MBP2067664.1 hypothetical protein [Streptomyces iranensis]CDR18222.1 predicted protein [Streptomyces iranensis]
MINAVVLISVRDGSAAGAVARRVETSVHVNYVQAVCGSYSLMALVNVASHAELAFLTGVEFEHTEGVKDIVTHIVSCSLEGCAGEPELGWLFRD